MPSSLERLLPVVYLRGQEECRLLDSMLPVLKNVWSTCRGKQHLPQQGVKEKRSRKHGVTKFLPTKRSTRA